MKKLFLHLIGFMVRTTDLALINIEFSALCMVFKSSYLSETVIENIEILESYINSSSVVRTMNPIKCKNNFFMSFLSLYFYLCKNQCHVINMQNINV